MELTIKTYILQGFDEEQAQRIESIIQYLSNKNGLQNQTQILKKLPQSLEANDYVVIFTDELSAGMLTRDKDNQKFFADKNYRNNQLLIIIDDVSTDSLPAYMHHLPVFALSNYNESWEQESLEPENQEFTKSNLVESLNDVIQFIKRSKQAPKSDRPTVFIGPFDDNTTYEYQKLTRELLYRHYNIVPEIANPTAKELIENPEYLKQLLQKADLAIHFIGHKSLLDYPEKESAAMKINAFAADFCKTNEGAGFSRTIYIPSQADDAPEMLELKISQFKSNANSLTHAELVQTPIEKFKEIILEKIAEIASPLTQKNIDVTTETDVYFIYPPGAEQMASEYFQWFEKHQVNFKTSQVDLDQLALLHYHQNQLAKCNKVIIYHTDNPNWFDQKVSDLIKSPGWGRNKPFEWIAICGNNNYSHKTLQMLKNQNIQLIENSGSPNKEKLKELFRK
jgi:hypothetical protein